MERGKVQTCEAWASRSIFSWIVRDDNLCWELEKQHRQQLIQHSLILLRQKQKL